ncbi:YqzE family protein [Pseudoneobacillus sp. C159]
MKTNDYVKYLTQTFVKYIDQPKVERELAKLAKKDEKEPFVYKWFGIFPYLFLNNIKRKRG